MLVRSVFATVMLLLGSDTNAVIFSRGQAALAGGDLGAAETAFQTVLKTEPKSVPALANLGVVYMRRKSWAKALAQFNAAERVSPGNPGLEINIGLAYFHQGNFAAALKPFLGVLQTDPASFQARYLVGLCLFATERYDEAVEALKPLWASESDKLSYLYVLALSADKAKNAELEQQALERMYQVGNGSAEYHLFLGRAWVARQRDDDALKELQEAARLNPALPFVHYSIGDIYLSQGEYARAKAEFLDDLQAEPDFVSNYEELGEACLKLEQLREAESFFEKATQLNPSARSYLGLAKIFKADGRLKEALLDLDEANKIDSQSASLHYLRAQTLVQLDRRTEAQVEFTTSTRLRKSTRDRLEQEVSSGRNVDAQIGLAPQ